MARGSNPKSLEALEKSRKKTQFRGEYAVKCGVKGNEVKRQLKPWKKLATDELSPEDQKATMRRIIELMKRGNLSAFELYLKLVGEHPDQDAGTDKTITITIDEAGYEN